MVIQAWLKFGSIVIYLTHFELMPKLRIHVTTEML